VDPSERANDRVALDAATELRAAIHSLGIATVDREPVAEDLLRAAELVRSAAGELRGDPARRRWDGPATTERDGLRSYSARSLFQGALHPFAPSLRWEDDAVGPDGQSALAFVVQLSGLYEGPPGAVHGGYVAGLFDELLGAVQGLTPDGGGFTGRLQVRYRSPTPLNSELRFHGWVVADRGRRVHAIGQCVAAGILCADAEAMFVRPVSGSRASTNRSAS
jgi:acyl-coenzyme A thioesterase PaaI-like protein